MKLYNNFTGGAMNKDLDLRVFPKGIYIDAQNIRIMSPEGQNARAVSNVLGTVQRSLLTFGANAVCVGSCTDTFRNIIYWAVASDSGSFVCEHTISDGLENIIISDNRAGENNVLGFTAGDYVEMRVINDNDNGKNFLVFTSANSNEPKFFEIEAAKLLTDNSFVLEDISLIKAPPFESPSITLGNTATNEENNIESKFLSFAYRYQYQNGEYSALSQFSVFGFMPDSFSYNYKAGTNSAMYNNFSKITLGLNTGTANVKKLQVIVKESGSNTAFIVNTYDRIDEGWTTDDATVTVDFDNSRIYKALDGTQLSRIYDNVPINAATMEIIGNRIVFGNYTEGYDLVYGVDDTPINLTMSLGYTGVTGTAGNVHETVKTNRDYELAISYSDGKGRITTPLTSDESTTFIPYSESEKKNSLTVTIDKDSNPPSWATSYRFYIKQSKTNYDVIAPVIFYRKGVYAWVKLEGNDIQKVGEGDFLYVKSDTSGLKAATVRTKVLEISVEERNFLETDPVIIDGDETLQESGVYMRLQVDGYALSSEAVTISEWIGYSFRTEATPNNFLGNVTYNETVYYDGSALDDLTVSGSASGSEDLRIEIEIDGTAPDTFRWRVWETSLDPNTGYGAYTSLVAITGAAQVITGTGISITFGATTGHTAGDKWFISAKAAARVDAWDGGGSVDSDGRKAIVLLEGKQPPDESIKAGAVITITYDDGASSLGNDSQVFFQQLSLTSSKDYPNLEEWFYGDSIIDSMGVLVTDVNDVLFRRGNILTKPDGQQMTVTGNVTDKMYMAFLSPANYTGGSTLRIDNSLTLTEFDNNVIFETIPVDVTTDIFYELSGSYEITSGRHIGKAGDTSQVIGVTDAVIELPYFNAFGWYNGFESYKIADTFNEKTMVIDTKPSIPIDEYKAITRIASLTYSDTYESTTQYNALNEFNLAEANYKDMDITYGAIRKLYSRDTDLMVFQHDKTHRVLFSKSVLFNGDGTGNVSQSSNVLGQEIAFTGEYGICSNPESFAFFGNRIYHLDKDRGALMRLSTDGYTELSQNGLRDYFRTLTSQTSFVGGYDPYNDEYLVNVVPDGSPKTLAYQEGIGFTSFYEYEPERLIGLNNRLYSIKDGQIHLHDQLSEITPVYNNFYGDQRVSSITTVFADSPNEIKHFKSVNTESSSAWDIAITTQSATSTITAEEFSLDEFEYYAYIRQSEVSAIATATESMGSFKGIGVITDITALVVSFGFTLPRSISEGDVIWEYDTDTELSVQRGTVTAIDYLNGTITLDSVAGLIVGDYVLYAKNSRVEGESHKGYELQLVLSNDSTSQEQLFAVKTEAVKSFD